MGKLARGTQIVRHTGQRGERDEAGFVTSGPTISGGYFCRFWCMRNGKVADPPTLRTLSTSELVLWKHIVVQDSIDQSYVDQALREHC